MDGRNRRRQFGGPCHCLRPLIRLWGVVTAIGETTLTSKTTEHKPPQQGSNNSAVVQQQQGFPFTVVAVVASATTTHLCCADGSMRPIAARKIKLAKRMIFVK
uniref:Secreted protein n=1 Tax=Anopheles merus TaxID=30066 RepID=A0A182VFD3_ANOME